MMANESQPSSFRSVVGTRLVQVLAVIALLVGIADGLVIFYNNLQEGRIKTPTANNAPNRSDAETRIAEQEATIKLEAARWAAEQQKAQAEKMKAEACSARAEANAKNMRVSDVLNGTYKGDEALARDCDPNYAARAARTAACSAKFDALLTITANDLDDDNDKRFETRVDQYRLECGKITQGDLDRLNYASVQAAQKECVARKLGTEADCKQLFPAATASAPLAPSRQPAPTPASAAPPPQTTGTLQQPELPARAPSQPTTKRVNFTTYENYDMMGGDLAKLANADPEDCAVACRLDPRCVAYSYDQWNRWCYPKSAITPLRLDARSLTAIRDDEPRPTFSNRPVTFARHRNKTFPAPAHPTAAPVASFEGCEDLCRSTKTCIAATFQKRFTQCQMYSSTAAYVDDRNADSTEKTQNASDQ